MDELKIEPIGYIKSSYRKKYEAPKQAHIEAEKEAIITLNQNMNFEMALQDLDGFSHIWIIYSFHKNNHWKPKVLPPRNTRKKKGLFATRSPYRPNPIGMSVVKLSKIKGRKLYIKNHDLLDGTPILDIKPYIKYADSHPEATMGWIDEIEETFREVFFSNDVLEKLKFLDENQIEFKNEIERRLSYDPFPHPYRRITKFENHYQLRFKEWCCDYLIKDNSIEITNVYSGFSDEKRKALKANNLHDVFIEKFK